MNEEEILKAQNIAINAREDYMRDLCQLVLEGKGSESDEREIEMFLLGFILGQQGYSEDWTFLQVCVQCKGV